MGGICSGAVVYVLPSSVDVGCYAEKDKNFTLVTTMNQQAQEAAQNTVVFGDVF